jgi:hypothetical protein
VDQATLVRKMLDDPVEMAQFKYALNIDAKVVLEARAVWSDVDADFAHFGIFHDFAK